MVFGQIAESKNINTLIYHCFENLPDSEQRKFVRKFREQPHDEAQIMHTLMELVCGAYLSSLGFQVIHEFKLNSETPDWCIVDDKLTPQAITDVVTIHIDKETDIDIENQLKAKNVAAYWMNGKSNNVDRLYKVIQAKSVKYRELVDSMSLPFVVAVHSDFRIQFDPNEILGCLLPNEYGIFALYPYVSGLLFFEDYGAQYNFQYFGNLNCVRKFNLGNGRYP